MNKFSVEKHGYPATKSETATNPQTWQTAKPARTVPVGIVYLGIMCLAVLIGVGYVGAYYLFDKSHDAPSVVQVQNDNEIVYVDRFVTVEVTRVIERIITATPQPATPTLTATKDLAPEYAALALSAAKRGNVLRWAGVILVIITFAFIGAVLIVAGVQAVLPEPINVEETGL